MRQDTDGMSSKEKYEIFCTKTYVPVFSKPWWMDAVCGPDNWDVLVIEESGCYKAAMPYYLTERDGKKLITKATLTQNNGVLFHYPPNQKYSSRLDFEERVMNQVCDYIESLGLDSTVEAAVNAAMIREALSGNVKAYIAIRDTLGQTTKSEEDLEEQKVRTAAVKARTGQLDDEEEELDDGFLDALQNSGDWEGWKQEDEEENPDI